MFRPLAVLCALALLAGCASETPTPTTQVTPGKPAASATPAPAPLPANLRELSGTLLNVPAGANVELALLVIDERDRPQQLLGNITLQGNGQPLPFQLPFNPDSFPANARVELHGRVTQSAQLILRLSPQRITSATTQALGNLRFDTAP
ncbi:putative lipoprotein YbaY [Pseudomonas sp. TE3786]